MEVIKTEGLTKHFYDPLRRQAITAVDNLDLIVERGEIFGFLGPNGAGKTTTIKMLLGLIFPTSGQAWVLGNPIGDKKTREKISYMPENPYFYDYMTGEDLLYFYGGLFGLKGEALRKKVDELLGIVGLSEHRKKELRGYSRGMLQRIGIAQALINDPELLILDEPTSGLDPIAHREVRELLIRLKEQGKTIFLCSHQLSDVEMVCDRVGIMNRGKLVRTGRLEDLLKVGEMEIAVEGLEPSKIDAAEKIASRVYKKNGDVLLYADGEDKAQEIIDFVRQNGGKILSMVPLRRSLEELFVEIVKEVS
ncbi:ABC transporter ATP-binding protein [bacterium]|nr:ABC transporter ATP-binding protein [bacterium]